MCVPGIGFGRGRYFFSSAAVNDRNFCSALYSEQVKRSLKHWIHEIKHDGYRCQLDRVEVLAGDGCKVVPA